MDENRKATCPKCVICGEQHINDWLQATGLAEHLWRACEIDGRFPILELLDKLVLKKQIGEVKIMPVPACAFIEFGEPKIVIECYPRFGSKVNLTLYNGETMLERRLFDPFDFDATLQQIYIWRERE